MLEPNPPQPQNNIERAQKYLRIQDLCKYLNIPRTALYRIRKQDNSFPLPYKLTPKVIVFKALDIDTWIEKQKQNEGENND